MVAADSRTAVGVKDRDSALSAGEGRARTGGGGAEVSEREAAA